MQAFGVARIGRDAELRQSGDQSVVNIALAFEYGRKGDDNKKPVQWVDAALWGKRAESLESYLKKGTKVFVTLRDVHIRTYQKSDGSEGVSLSGTVTEIELVSRPQQQQTSAPAPAPRPAPAPKPPAAAPASDDWDDDIPF